MSLCGGWSLVKMTDLGTSAIRLWCRSWTCPDCGAYRVAALKKEGAAGNPTTFITLTVNPAHGQSPEDRARELSNAWRIVVKRARRKFLKAPLEYLAVFEATKKGEPHLHILCRAPFIPQKWLSDQMAELIQAPIVDIRRVHGNREVARYVAKYVGKGPKPFASLKRYWSSPKYVVKTKKKDTADCPWGSGWRCWKDSLETIADTWRHQYRAIEWVNENEWFSGIGTAWRLNC